MVLTGTDARAVRPYSGLHVMALTGTDAISLDTSRASLQRVTRYGVPTKSLLVRLAGG